MWMITSPYLYAECWNTVKMIEHHWNETAKTKMTACDLHTLKYYMQSPSHWRWWVLHQGQVIETINIHYQHPSLSEPSCCQDHPKKQLAHWSAWQQWHTPQPRVPGQTLRLFCDRSRRQLQDRPRQRPGHHRSKWQRPAGWQPAWEFVPPQSSCFHPPGPHFEVNHRDVGSGHRQIGVAGNLFQKMSELSLEAHHMSGSAKLTLRYFVRWAKKCWCSPVHPRKKKLHPGSWQH